jgi:hypothetical protein
MAFAALLFSAAVCPSLVRAAATFVIHLVPCIFLTPQLTLFAMGIPSVRQKIFSTGKICIAQRKENPPGGHRRII